MLCYQLAFLYTSSLAIEIKPVARRLSVCSSLVHSVAQRAAYLLGNLSSAILTSSIGD